MIFIVCGIPGTGKSEVTKNLSSKLNALVVNTDAVHELLYPEGAYTDTGDFTQESLIAVYKSLPLLAHYLLAISSNKNIIFEGSFRLAKQRQAILDIVNEHKVEARIILVTVDQDSKVKERLEKRKKLGQAGDYQSYLDIKEIFEVPREAVVLENNGNFEELALKINRLVDQLNIKG